MKLLIKIILPVCLIVAGAAGWHYFKSSKPEIKRKPPGQQAVVVKTIVMEKGDYPTWVHAMGTVMPDRQIMLKSKLAGEIISVSRKFVQGGVMKKGEMLLQLDDSDYKIEVQKTRSALDKTIAYLAIEKGSQLIAKEELKLINKASPGEITATDLALRKPQLTQANAEIANARADLEKAELNLSRTKVYLPFNALILEKHVDSGSLVTAQGMLASIVDVDRYKVEALVPQDRLALFGTGRMSNADAFINSNYSNQTWKGTVSGTTGKITPESRMAGVIILVPDPLGLKIKGGRPQLLLDDYVNVRIRGPILENIFSLPRSAVRDHNTVWVYNSGILEIRKIKPVWKEESVIYVKTGINTGDRVITSDLPVAVDGLALQMAPRESS
ncbi:MAG: efflux RND transporter periplasmic adaptor subunit [Deltaproteobacteria bacterium]|nr:efflux RND transporter periplasmic adaptor subunit [Deltaproteobacteria bacterium]